MIVFMSLTDFMKNKKSLVEAKDYMIGDATDDAVGELTKFATSISLNGLKPPKGVVALLKSTKEKEFDIAKLEKLEKKYIKGDEFRNAAIGLVISQSKCDKNFFIVFRDKDWKAYGKKIVKTFKHLFPTDDSVFVTFGDVKDKKKLLRVTLSNDTCDELRKGTKRLIKKLEKAEEIKKVEKDKKKKKKDADKKDKKKKKKKGKKDKWLKGI